MMIQFLEICNSESYICQNTPMGDIWLFENKPENINENWGTWEGEFCVLDDGLFKEIQTDLEKLDCLKTRPFKVKEILNMVKKEDIFIFVQVEKY